MSGARRHWLARATRAHVRSRRWRIWAVLLALVAVASCTQPLLGTLGFAFAFVLALPASIASIDLGSALVRQARATEAHAFDHAHGAWRIVGRLWGRAIAAAWLLLVVPILVAALDGLRVQTCDVGFGIYALVAMPMVSMVYGSAVGIGLGLVARRRRGSIALPYLFVALAVMASVVSFYVSPPVFFYNPLVGYFPGNLYDESIALGSTFWWARLFHLAYALAALAALTIAVDVPTLSLRRRAPRPAGRRRLEIGAALAFTALAGALWVSSARLGFAVSSQDIQAFLGGHLRTEHFDLYYPDSLNPDQVRLLAEDHEFRYAQVVRDLGAAPRGRIISYTFSDDDAKHRWMGARRVHMTKPWRRELYVNEQPFPHRVIRHEIAHAVASAFGSPVFRVSAGSVLGVPVEFNPGLIEGLAVAADWPGSFQQALTPHQSVKAMLELGVAPPLSRILGTAFFAYSGARSYTVAGSFVRYLLHRYGAAKVRALYRSGGDFDAVFGRPQEQLVAEWNQMIQGIELPAGAAAVVRERFRTGSIFSRPCPSFVARTMARVARLSAKGHHDRAITLWRQVCRDVPGEPQYWLDLAELYLRAERPKDARPVLERLAGDEHQTSSVRADALLQLARIDVAAGQRQAAAQRLDAALSLPLGDDAARNAETMRWVLAHRGPASSLLEKYFFAAREVDDADRRIVLLGWLAQAAAADPDNALVHYLIGRNLAGRDAPAATARSLARALDLGLPNALLTRECARLLAPAAYAAGETGQVERAAGILLGADQPRMMKLYALDWLERLEWKRTEKVPSPRLTVDDWQERVGATHPGVAAQLARDHYAPHEPGVHAGEQPR